MDVLSGVGVEGGVQEVSQREYPHVRAVERHPVAHERASTDTLLPIGGINSQPIRNQNSAYS